ncbi:PKD domain-containing protein [Agromyces sp. NPDC058484]|uniref:PKD domain-containing protein n=1 Tax=Agromyces sp. NPDC058484 TaxID=3346524 RepID=UPI0036646491
MGAAVFTRLRVLTLSVAAALVASVFVAAGPAAADTSPPDPGTPVTFAADALPTVQLDGVVWSQAIVGNTVYVGGEFTTAQPAGAAVGVNTVPRANLLAYNLTTGELISTWNPGTNGPVQAVVASPDGSRVYIGGSFTSAGGQNRYRIAAFDTATGALVSPWNPGTNARVTSLAVTSTTLYVGGIFSSAGGGTRNDLAAFTTASGALLPWTATVANGGVEALAAKSDGSQVVVGGSFTSLNGSSNPGYGLGSIHGTTGALLPWAINSKVRNGTSQGAILSLTSDAASVYGVGYTFGRAGGTLEGTFKASWNGGTLEWVEDCHGDTYSAVPVGDVVYTTSHAHYCGNVPGGFPQTTPWTFYRALAFTNYPDGVAGREPYGYTNWEGTPAPRLLSWYPEINSGTFTGQSQGPWNIATNGQYLSYGGEFTIVNNKRQQGLVRFAVKEIAPNNQGPRITAAEFVPGGVALAAGTIRVNWKTNYDRDNESLIYRVYRDGNMTTPVYETTSRSVVWNRPTIGFTDTGLVPGQSYTYRLRAIDPYGNTSTGDWKTLTAGTSGTLSNYAESVLADAANFWPLGEASGSTVYDWAGGDDGTARSGVTRGVTGAIFGDSGKASHFDGGTGGYVSTATLKTAPNTFTLESWFKTNTGQGGKIIGFGSASSGNSTTYDRHLYMTNAGRIVFGAFPGSAQTITSPAAYNNNQWHHVAASLGPNGMALYVDGALVAQRADVTTGQAYSGYWRIGGDSLASWPSRPNRDYFGGDIDEAAVYMKVLTPATIANHYQIGKTGAGTNQPPVADFTAVATGLAVAFDATGSDDPDGTIASYAWDFGDGQTGTGATPTHTYADGGTYTVGLTVTDDDGATGSTSQSVVVTAPPPGTPLATDEFERNVVNGLGTADSGGAWTVTGSMSNYSVTGGTGRLRASAGGTVNGYLGAVSSDDTEVRVQLALQQAATGGGAYASVIARRVGTDDYRARVKVLSSGTVQLQLMRGGTTLQTATIPGVAYTTGEQLQVRVQAFDTAPTTLRAKVWEVGAAEPAAWQLTTTDTTAAMQQAGSIGLSLFLSGSATTSPLTVAFDKLWAGATTDAPPANTPPTAAFTPTPTGLSVAVDGGASSDPDGSIASYAWDFGDGGTATGATASHTYAAGGSYPVTLTVTDDGGATDSEVQTVTVTAPGNAPPTAAFTATPTGLSVAVDGGGSSDPDGSIASYAWDFGDGGTATGATASHTYAAGGSYPVTLTVTDNGGATDAETQSVTVTDPGQPAPFAQDAFERTVTGGLGSADLGGTWSGASANLAVNGGAARLTAPGAGATTTSMLNGATSTDADVQVELALQQAASGGGTYVSVIGRAVVGNDYRARVKITSAGVVQLQLMRGGTTLQALNIAGLTYATGDELQVRLQVFGTSPTTIRGKVWKVGTAEPAAWQLSTTDATAALQAAGGLGLSVYVSGSATVVPLTVAFDDLVARPTN